MLIVAVVVAVIDYEGILLARQKIKSEKTEEKNVHRMATLTFASGG